MNALAIINKYYSEENELKHILLTHSRSVADKALQIAVKHPELHLDTGIGLRASHRGRNVITKHHRAGFTDSAS